MGENENNESALDLTKANNRKEVVNLLEQNGLQLENSIHKITALPIRLTRIITKLLLGKNCTFNQLNILEASAPKVEPKGENSRCIVQ